MATRYPCVAMVTASPSPSLLSPPPGLLVRSHLRSQGGSPGGGQGAAGEQRLP